MVFASPEVLWLLLGWPLLVWGSVRAARRQGRWATAVGTRRRPWLGVAGTTAVAVLVLGLADPRSVSGSPGRLRDVDGMVVWDHSASMLAGADRSRFERSRQELRALLAEGSVERLGVVAFAGDAEVVCPLTSDHSVLGEILEGRRPQQMKLGGSDLGSGIELALQRLDDDAPAFLLVVSDGESWRESASLDRALEEAVRRGVPVYARCQDEPRNAQLFDRVDGVAVPLLDESSAPVFSKADPDRLEELVRRSGGRLLDSTTGNTLAVALARDGVVARERLRAWSGFWILAWCLLLAALALRGRP